MSSRELSEWIAYDRIEPLPEPWRQTGIVAALLHNAHFKGAKQARDFMPIAAPREPQSAAEGLAKLAAIAARFAAHQVDHQEDQTPWQ